MTGAHGGRLVVLGDALLDVDVDGTVERVSPDAPVPVLDERGCRVRPGGAALAAELLARDGHEVVLVCPLAHDEPAEQLLAALHHGVNVLTLPYSGQTPTKRRFRAGGQSLLRVDTGSTGDVGEPPPAVADVLRSARGVLVADYGRGATSHPTLRDWLAGLGTDGIDGRGRSPRVPVVWDPHPRGAAPVAGVRLATPNAAEAQTFAAELGAHLPGPPGGLGAVSAAAAALVHGWHSQAVTVTVGPRGALVSYGSGAPVVVPARAVDRADGVDTCGAGDRFATAALAAMADGAVTTEAVQAAVEAATDYVAAGGAAGLSPTIETDRTDRRQGRPADLGAEAYADRVRSAGGTVVATGGCFDLLHAGHVESLRAARSLGDCLVVCLNSDASVRRLKGPGRPVVPEADRARLLQALEFVDAVLVFDEDTPEQALRRLRPDVWAKGGDYAGADLPEAAVLADWDGAVVVLPYLLGRSTTRIVDALLTGGGS